MEVYISEKYLDKVESLLSKPSTIQEIISGEQTNLHAVYNLFSALPLITDLSDAKLEEMTRKLIANKEFKTIKDQLLFHALKQNRLYNGYNQTAFSEDKNLSAFFFIDEEDKEDTEKTFGVVIKDQNCGFDNFYSSYTHAGTSINDNWEPILHTIPPTNAMLIVDPYIFKSNRRLDTRDKVNNLLDFIETHSKNIKIPFHVSIVFKDSFADNELPIDTDIIDNVLEHISSLGNCEVELIVVPRYVHVHDRLIFTNYTTINIGIPFESRETLYNQNFLGVEYDSRKVTENYRIYIKELLKWKSAIRNRPEFEWGRRQKWKTSKFENRLFRNIQK